MIEIENLTYTYPDGTRALDAVKLRVNKKERLAVIGSNGAGKSTLLLQLNGILRGTGEIRIQGLDMTDRNLPEIRRMVGLVFQDPEDQLFMPTVREDVAFGPANMGLSKIDVARAVERALAVVGMSNYESRSAHHLSLGERKKISIATVLAMHPQLLVFDEPTSNLDPKSRRELIKLMNALEATKIIATHDLDLVDQTCDRVIWMDKGRIIRDGDREDVLRSFSEQMDQ